MKNIIITDEELIRYSDVFSASIHKLSNLDARRAALADFLNNHPQVAQLRPIAEMPEKVPEGCVRVYMWMDHGGFGGQPSFICRKQDNFSHFIDIQLPTPDPDAEERQQFEEAMKKACPDFNFTLEQDGKTYRSIRVDAAWIAWSVRGQLAKKGGDK